MARPARARWRTWLLVTHRWLGIPSSLVLIVVALTGAALVNESALDRVLAPQLHAVTPVGPRLSYDSLVAIATRARPRRVPASVVRPAARADDAVLILFKYQQVYVDPYRGIVLGERGMGASPVGITRVLHHSLLVNRVGRIVTVTATAACVLLSLGGIVLWWPRKILWFRRGASWRRWNFDLHNVGGVLIVVPMLLFGGSALAMALTGPLDPVYRRWFGDARPTRLTPASPRSAAPLSIDSIIRLGDAAVSGRLFEVTLPPEPHGTYQVLKHAPDEFGNRARNSAFIDGNDGRVRGVIDQTQLPLGARLSLRMEDWHIAAFAPPWSRWVGVVSCLLLAVASATGPLIWWKPRRRLRADSRD